MALAAYNRILQAYRLEGMCHWKGDEAGHRDTKESCRQERCTGELPGEAISSERKRRRPAHDVDGPHTEVLSCKKRRLRRELITSRLSQPYSLPATHIIHRATVDGDTRAVGLSIAVASSRKQKTTGRPRGKPMVEPEDMVPAIQQSTGPVPGRKTPAEMVRRAAILNRLRLRAGDNVRSKTQGTDCMTANNGNLCGEGELPPGANLEYTCSSAASSSTTRDSHEDDDTEHNMAGVSKASSPRLGPLRSPQPRGVGSLINRPMEEDELDDNVLSFPTSIFTDDDGSADTEEIYTDFSVIFGGGGETRPAPEVEQANERHSGESVEEMMDDVDGIPWGAR